MKKLNFAVALGALAAVLSTPVYAADVEPMPAAADWTAFHVGIGGGGNFVFSQQSSEAFISEVCTDCDVLDFESSSDLGKAGAFGTIEGGFDYQMDSMVFGVLANYDFGKTSMDSSASNSQDGFGQDVDTEISTNLEVGDSWAAGARFGLLPTERTLLYVLGGYTQANISQDANVNGTLLLDPPVPFDESVSGSGWESGYFVGTGIETMFTDNITIKLEYRFADYGKVGINHEEPVSIPGQGESTAGGGQSDDVTVHSVRAVLSYRF